MKIAIIGASGHAPFVLEGLRRRPFGSDALVGLAPGSEGESVAAFGEACRAAGWSPQLYDDHRAMLDRERPDVVAVNPFFYDHEGIALELLERGGMHLFVEKPLALTLAGLARVRAAHASSDVRLGCMLNMRYEPALRAAYNAVHAGAIGEVRLLHTQKSYRLGTRPDFFRKRATFGGLIPWVGSHAIDLITCLSGQRFVSVQAAHSTRANRGHDELEVSAACLFQMTEEVMATANIDYLRPAAAPTHEDDRVRVAGTEGVVEVRDGRAILTTAAGVSELRPDTTTSLFGDFLDELEGRGRCLVTSAEAFANTEIALRTRDAADTGKTVYF